MRPPRGRVVATVHADCGLGDQPDAAQIVGQIDILRTDASESSAKDLYLR